MRRIQGPAFFAFDQYGSPCGGSIATHDGLGMATVAANRIFVGQAPWVRPRADGIFLYRGPSSRAGLAVTTVRMRTFLDPKDADFDNRGPVFFLAVLPEEGRWIAGAAFHQGEDVGVVAKAFFRWQGRYVRQRRIAGEDGRDWAASCRRAGPVILEQDTEKVFVGLYGGGERDFDALDDLKRIARDLGGVADQGPTYERPCGGPCDRLILLPCEPDIRRRFIERAAQSANIRQMFFDTEEAERRVDPDLGYALTVAQVQVDTAMEMRGADFIQ